MAKASLIDALFDRIITDLEVALDLAVLADRDDHLAAIARRVGRLHHLIQAALILHGEDSSATPPKPLD